MRPNGWRTFGRIAICKPQRKWMVDTAHNFSFHSIMRNQMQASIRVLICMLHQSIYELEFRYLLRIYKYFGNVFGGTKADFYPIYLDEIIRYSPGIWGIATKRWVNAKTPFVPSSHFDSISDLHTTEWVFNVTSIYMPH